MTQMQIIRQYLLKDKNDKNTIDFPESKMIGESG
jgi:hypothetical protein